MSFGREFQQIHKQVQDEMQARITELEDELRAKELQLEEARTASQADALSL